MGKRKLIGIFATEISSRVQSNLYRELHEKAQDLGYNLVLFSGTYGLTNINSTTSETYRLYELAESMEFAAFIIHAQSIGNAEMIRYLIEMGKTKDIPIFLYDCEVAGIQLGEGIINIKPDYKKGFAESVRHLIEFHHCRNIYMLAGMRNNKYSDDRVEMYRQEMISHGLDFHEEQIGYGDFWEIPAAAAVNGFLESGLPAPEAICCANDAMAITACKVLRQRGFRVPEDVLVTGFDGIEDGKYNLPAIATCEPCLDAVADFIFDVLEGTNDAEEFLIPLRFLPKESCGCVNSSSLEDKLEIAGLVENTRVSGWQEHMLATMLVELIESSVLSDSIGYMIGTLDLFKGYSHLFCLRDDIEFRSDYTEPFGKMRVHLNKGFLPEKEYADFRVEDIVPEYETVFGKAAPEDIFIFRLNHCSNKLYGYDIARVNKYVSNEIKLLAQFTERFTYVVECILRNMRLKQANFKLSEMYERMSEIYIRDTMTGLYNRHGYYRELDEYIKREELQQGFLHVVSIDMDGMKLINDNYGHLEGDIAIKAVAKAINDCFAQPCICARFGGDEFQVALFTENGEEPTAEKISQKLNHYLESMAALADKKYTVGVSIGQAIEKLIYIDDLRDVEKLADDLMYRDKRRRKGLE